MAGIVILGFNIAVGGGAVVFVLDADASAGDEEGDKEEEGMAFCILARTTWYG